MILDLVERLSRWEGVGYYFDVVDHNGDEPEELEGYSAVQALETVQCIEVVTKRLRDELLAMPPDGLMREVCERLQSVISVLGMELRSLRMRALPPAVGNLVADDETVLRDVKRAMRIAHDGCKPGLLDVAFKVGVRAAAVGLEPLNNSTTSPAKSPKAVGVMPPGDSVAAADGKSGAKAKSGSQVHGTVPSAAVVTVSTQPPNDTRADSQLCTQALEQILEGHMQAICGDTNAIYRDLTKGDNGIDGELEFRNNEGNASGRKVYVQLKSGDSHLRLRQADGKLIFDVQNPRHLEYWQSQPCDVWLVIRDGHGTICWMNITQYLRDRPNKTCLQIEFDGSPLTASAIRLLGEAVIPASNR